MIAACVSEAKGRVPVIAGAGSNNTQEAIELARFAEKAGADGLLVVTPYYNKPSQEGLYRHFKAVNDAVGIPIIIYNIPPRSVVDMSIDTMKRLFELKNIAGVKDATGNLARTALQRQALGPDFIQLSGEDMTALAVMAHGGHGCISVTSNVAPNLCSRMQEACLRGDFPAALKLQDQLTPLHAALFVEPNPAGPKYALSAARQDFRRNPASHAARLGDGASRDQGGDDPCRAYSCVTRKTRAGCPEVAAKKSARARSPRTTGRRATITKSAKPSKRG